MKQYEKYTIMNSIADVPPANGVAVPHQLRALLSWTRHYMVVTHEEVADFVELGL